jgi:hypothetical protein
VYKAVIVNLDVIGEANYREGVHVWEVPLYMCLMHAQFICAISSSHPRQDLDFNLRISGQERQEGGSSSKLSEHAALKQPCGGAWLSGNTMTQAGETILESTDPPGPAVVVKCYRFAYRQDQSIKKVRGNACPHATRPRCQLKPMPIRRRFSRQSSRSCYRQGGASGGVQRPDAVEATVEATVEEELRLLEEELGRLEAKLKALQQEEEDLKKVEDYVDRDYGRLEEIKNAAEAAEEEERQLAAKVAEVRSRADQAERQQKKREVSELEGKLASADNKKEYKTAGELQKQIKRLLEELEQPPAKRARSTPADA